MSGAAGCVIALTLSTRAIGNGAQDVDGNMARPKWLSAGDIVLLASIAVGSMVLLVIAGGLGRA